MACFAAFALSSTALCAQTTWVKNNHALELTGVIQTMYNHRFYEHTATDQKKNRFLLDDARLQLNGKIKSKWAYQVELNMADLVRVVVDKNQYTPIINANVAYTKLSNIEIKVGYQRIPFSVSSMTPFFYSAFLQRPEMARGDFFSRRDVGVVIDYSVLNECLSATAGVFTGMGEQSLLGDNDASGAPEYTARIAYSYPSKYRYRDIDLYGTPTPQVRIGANARYANKRSNTGADYGMKTINGEKYLYGADFSFQYQHFAAQFEILQARLQHRVPTTTEIAYNTNYQLAGGIAAQISYAVPQVRSSLALRYDDFNPNDLVLGDMARTVSVGYVYFIDDYKTAFRVHYFKRLADGTNAKAFTDDQIRAALQFTF